MTLHDLKHDFLILNVVTGQISSFSLSLSIWYFQKLFNIKYFTNIGLQTNQKLWFWRTHFTSHITLLSLFSTQYQGVNTCGQLFKKAVFFYCVWVRRLKAWSVYRPYSCKYYLVEDIFKKHQIFLTLKSTNKNAVY